MNGLRWIVGFSCLWVACGDDGASGSASLSGSSSASASASASADDGEATSADDGSSSVSTSATSVGSASASSVGSSESGDAPVGCMQGALESDAADPEHRGTAMGDNGMFEDACDRNGDLLEYVCETMSVCSDPPNPDCEYPQTGNVVPQMFDCDGTCVDGTCNGRCAMVGDDLVYVSAGDGTAEFDTPDDGRRYACMLLFDSAMDSFDCNTTPQPGDMAVITSLGLSGNFCTGGAWGNIGIGMPEQCAYACTYEYP